MKRSVGDKLYGVIHTNNAFSRQKVSRVIDGETWFKYDKPIAEYEINELTILGIVTPVLEGEWGDREYELESLDIKYYHSSNQDSSKYVARQNEIGEDWALFYTKEEAEEYINKMMVDNES